MWEYLKSFKTENQDFLHFCTLVAQKLCAKFNFERIFRQLQNVTCNIYVQAENPIIYINFNIEKKSGMILSQLPYLIKKMIPADNFQLVTVKKSQLYNLNWPMKFVPRSTISRDIVEQGTNSIGQLVQLEIWSVLSWSS